MGMSILGIKATLLMVWAMSDDLECSDLPSMWLHGSAEWRRLWARGQTRKVMYA
jgi:hypothetical protein